jgi:hypothetical protein
LHDVPEEVIEEALRTDAPAPEEPPIIGAYPGSPIRSVGVPPWLSHDVEEEPQCDLGIITSCNPGPPPPRFIAATEGTPGPASSIIAQASECTTEHHLAEDDDASDIDADGDADIDVDVDTTPMSPSFESATPLPLDVSGLAPVAVAGPSTTNNNNNNNNNNTGTSAAPAPGAITGSGMAIDARVTSLDEALVNLWVRNTSLSHAWIDLLTDKTNNRATSCACKSRIAKPKQTTKPSRTVQKPSQPV